MLFGDLATLAVCGWGGRMFWCTIYVLFSLLENGMEGSTKGFLKVFLGLLELSWYLYFYPKSGRFFIGFAFILHEHGIILISIWERGEKDVLWRRWTL